MSYARIKAAVCALRRAKPYDHKIADCYFKGRAQIRLLLMNLIRTRIEVLFTRLCRVERLHLSGVNNFDRKGSGMLLYLN